MKLKCCILFSMWQGSLTINTYSHLGPPTNIFEGRSFGETSAADSSMSITRRQLQNILSTGEFSFLVSSSSSSKAQKTPSDVPASDDECCWNHINGIAWRQASAVHTLLTTSSNAPDYASVFLAPAQPRGFCLKTSWLYYAADSRSLDWKNICTLFLITNELSDDWICSSAVD